MTDAPAIDRARAEFDADLARAASDADLRDLRDRYLGRKSGIVTSLLKAVAAAPGEVRPQLGRLANQLKQHVDAAIDEHRAALAAEGPPVHCVDVTLPGSETLLRSRPPLPSMGE